MLLCGTDGRAPGRSLASGKRHAAGSEHAAGGVSAMPSVRVSPVTVSLFIATQVALHRHLPLNFWNRIYSVTVEPLLKKNKMRFRFLPQNLP